jgi:hypothetical protein
MITEYTVLSYKFSKHKNNVTYTRTESMTEQLRSKLRYKLSSSTDPSLVTKTPHVRKSVAVN